jgi:uncharacterized membrane protein YeaQ/YmgE (transglycosylase-associated protein family)
MLVGTIIGWIIAGLIVGAIARLLVPGRQGMGVAMTIILGIAGALLAGFVGSFIFGPHLVTDGTQVYAVETAWPGWLMAIVGAAVLLWLTSTFAGTDSTRRL